MYLQILPPSQNIASFRVQNLSYNIAISEFSLVLLGMN
uniref:Uncharacterized protein n=1 Tax=Arundo donax TaxID=35708 RepID=A0A0A8YDG0_ARUDO